MIASMLNIPPNCTPSQRKVIPRVLSSIEQQRGLDPVTSASVTWARSDRTLMVSVVAISRLCNAAQGVRYRHWCLFIGPRGGLRAYPRGVTPAVGERALAPIVDSGSQEKA